MKPIPAAIYINSEGLSRPIPLERFLPDCPVGVVRQSLAVAAGEKGWILDPFGSNPLLDIEAACCGRRILVTGNNPILAFTLKMLATPRKKSDYLSALTEFASLSRGEDRLETHIRALYTTRCAICHQEIQASGYLWQRGTEQPYARLYRCPHCGDEGERAITEEDRAILEPLQRGEKIHHARAVRQVFSDEDERPVVEEALKLYNPRALYVLFTLLNKREGINLSPEKRELLDALLISALDAGNSLWPWPNITDPPRQLTLPAVYLEKNIWLELEQSIDLWSQPASPIALTSWPDLPIEGGVCLYRGPIRNLKLPPEVNIGHLLCLPPRPNQALWTLSALWSAWIWGRKSETSFSQVLGRRRFDWHWHTRALHQALEKAQQLSVKSVDAFMLIGEPSAPMMLAACAAANCAGLELTGMAYQSSYAPIQTWWKSAGGARNASIQNLQMIARKAIQDLLNELGEPLDYLPLYSAICASLVVNQGIPQSIEQFSQEKSSELQGILSRLFADRDFLRRFEATSQELDSGKWGLVQPEDSQIPLADRVEKKMVELLQTGENVTLPSMHEKLAADFRGFLTPPMDLVEFCLNSYADWNESTQTWQIKAGETGSKRDHDLKEVRSLLNSLGKKLGFNNPDGEPVVWKKGESTIFRFNLSTLACIPQLLEPDDPEIQDILVFPGSRAALLKFKLLRDAQLHERVARNWHFLKFRTLRNLVARADISPVIWTMMLDSDPIALEETAQLRMFG